MASRTDLQKIRRMIQSMICPMRNMTYPALALSMTIGRGALLADEVPHLIGRYPQEISRRYGLAEGLPSTNIVAVQIDAANTVFAVTDGGLARFHEGRWRLVESSGERPSAMTTAVLMPEGRTAALPLAPRELRQLVWEGKSVLAIGEQGLLKFGGSKRPKHLLPGRKINQVSVSPSGRWLVAANDGLFDWDNANTLTRLRIEDGLGRHWATADVLGATFDSQGQLWFATKAGLGKRDVQGQWRFYEGTDGLPFNEFTCLAADSQGAIWAGTRKGVVRFANGHWAYRQGLRWLPHDQVRGMSLDRQGNAWLATPGGVGWIGRRAMTLAEKAEVYEEEIESYIRRTPLGYVSEANLAAPGDRSRVIQEDSDNDGLWTSMYGAGECFAFGASRAPKAKLRAQRAFEALRFLQKVTQGGESSPPKGFVARTIRSTTLPDPNIGRLEADRRFRAERDAFWKVYAPRWPKSADRQWFWKGDTSSDELDGHYFFYPLYFDLVADSLEEKNRVREVVRDLTDHLIAHDYALVDHDGKPTRWAVYSPVALNHNPQWWSERGLNSLSILAYLAVAEHITGDPKYGQHSKLLRAEHGYDINAMVAKIQYGLGSGNQSDDEMAVMNFYNLTKYTRDDALKEQMRYAFYTYWMLLQPAMNPFFNFAYAAAGQNATYTNPWGTHAIPPWPGWLEDALTTLQGFPLDRVNWAHQNSHRLDIVLLPRQQAGDAYDRTVPQRGHLRNGKVLPVEERHFNHWNTDAWRLDYAGDGRTLASGTVFLLPYYMGLYHGFLKETPSPN